MLCHPFFQLPAWFATQINSCWVTACLFYLAALGVLAYLTREKLYQAWINLAYMRFQVDPAVWHTPALPGSPTRAQAPLRQGKPKPKVYPGIKPKESYTFFSQVDDIPGAEWDPLVPSHKLFLQRSYLKAMELAPTTNTQYRYALLHREGDPVGVATFQILDIPLDELGTAVNVDRVQSALRWTGSLHDTPDGRPAIRLLVCGNPLLSDSVSFAHLDSIPVEEVLAVLPKMLTTLRKKEEKHAPTTFVVVKDLLSNEAEQATALLSKEYHTLRTDPTMDIDIRPSWKTTEDYLNDMVSKYRQRYRSARKKGKSINRRALTPEEIEQHSARLQELLDNVGGNAPFRLTQTKVETFAQLKRSLGDNFQLTAYEVDDKVIGFAAMFFQRESLEVPGSESRLEAYLVGFDYEYNHSHKIYLNMLYDFVERGIESGVGQVHLGRTAWEIKSTIGGVPSYRHTFLRHHNSIINYFLSPLLTLVPPTEWKPRNPFKS